MTEVNMNRILVITLAAIGSTLFFHPALAEQGNAERGQRAFRACAPCHSLEPNRNMTGPSLSGLWNRQAGALASFRRYSPALKSSGIIWADNSLDAYIEDPQTFIPENEMTFRGIKEAQVRADLLAFLKDATQPGRQPATSAQMGGGMTGGETPNLKNLSPEDRVQAIRYCEDSYKVTTADGKTRNFWERNLRFKTDSSSEGPQKGAPAIVGAGMMGDRASVIFATPEEISQAIRQECADTKPQ